MPSSDVAADMSSSDSLSFAGMVCIQEQHSKLPARALSPGHQRKTNQGSKDDSDFEFSYSTQATVAINLPSKSPSNNLSHLKPDHQSQVYGHVTMKDIFESCSNGHRSSSTNKSPPAIMSQPDSPSVSYRPVTVKDVLQPCSSGRRSNTKEIGHSKPAKKTNTEVRKNGRKENSVGFGQKFIQSITSPCRTCRAIEPSSSIKRTQMGQRE